MAEAPLPIICICPNCLTPAGEPGPCQVCGHQRLVCQPGAPDDICRKPLMSADGKIKTQAPRWWLALTVGETAWQAVEPRPGRPPGKANEARVE